MSFQATTAVIAHSRQTQQRNFTALFILASHARPDGTNVYIKTETLAKESRMSERSAHSALADLLASGELVVRKGAGPRGTNLYAIRVPGMAAWDDPDRYRDPEPEVKEEGPEPVALHANGNGNGHAPKRSPHVVMVEHGDLSEYQLAYSTDPGDVPTMKKRMAGDVELCVMGLKGQLGIDPPRPFREAVRHHFIEARVLKEPYLEHIKAMGRHVSAADNYQDVVDGEIAADEFWAYCFKVLRYLVLHPEKELVAR